MATENTKHLLEEWLERAKQSHHSHRSAAKAFSHRNLYLGIISVVLSAIVGTSVFASLSKQIDISIQIIVGILSMLAAVFSALNTFLRYGEVSAKHATAASKYSSACRLIELQLANGYQSINSEELNNIRCRLDKLASDSPNVPEEYRKK